MEVTSDVYEEIERKANFSAYPQSEYGKGFCSLSIIEQTSVGQTNELKIRFNSDLKVDKLFFDQLRSAVEQVGKFLRP